MKCRKHIYTDEKVFIMGSPSNRADDSDTLKFIGEHIFPLSKFAKNEPIYKYPVSLMQKEADTPIS